MQDHRADHRRKHISPLRYPGGKAALAGFLAETIELNGLSGCSYYEPFAGGAGAGLRLLADDVVSEAHLNDIDSRIVAFWTAVLDEPDRFAEAILEVRVDVDEWRRQSAICDEADMSKPFELGFAVFYLNRCNRSGVINGAAPIGGYAQDGEWKIDARFYRESLVRRVRALADLRDRIRITELDAYDFLVDHVPSDLRRESIFVYLDPPYYEKGGRLYFDSYDDREHQKLAEYLTQHETLKWIVSYDASDFIRDIYASCNISDTLLRYSLHRKREAGELLITPSHLELPDQIGSSSVDADETRKGGIHAGP